MYIITPETFKARKYLAYAPLITFHIFLLLTYFIHDFFPIQSFSIFIWLLIVAAIIIMISFGYISFTTTKITLTQNTLQYKRLLTNYNINWNEIVESKISYKLFSRTAGLNWTFITNNEKQFTVNAHFFSKKNNQKLAEILLNRCPQCRISGKVKRFAANDFPWYYF